MKKIETVKSDLDDVIEECYAKNKYNEKLSRVNTNLVEKIKGFVAEYYTLTVDKKNFEVKAVKTSHDYMELRTEVNT